MVGGARSTPVTCCSFRVRTHANHNIRWEAIAPSAQARKGVDYSALPRLFAPCFSVLARPRSISSTFASAAIAGLKLLQAGLRRQHTRCVRDVACERGTIGDLSHPPLRGRRELLAARNHRRCRCWSGPYTPGMHVHVTLEAWMVQCGSREDRFVRRGRCAWRRGHPNITAEMKRTGALLLWTQSRVRA